MSGLKPKQLAALIESANNEARAAEAHNGKRGDFTIHTEYPEDGQNLTHGSVVLGLRCPKDGDAARLAALCAFSTDWGILVDKVEVIDLNPEERGVLIGLRNISNSVNFIHARLKTACRCIFAAATTIPNVEAVGSYATMEEGLSKMREDYPGVEAARQRIVARLLGATGYIRNQEECEEALAVLRSPEGMEAEFFERLLIVGEKMMAQLSSRAIPPLATSLEVLNDAMNRSPWMVQPGGSIVRKQDSTHRPAG
jgi:hypothetical protein